MLFRIESCRQRDLLQELVSTLIEWLDGPELADLRRAFAAWLNKVVLTRLSNERALITNELWEEPAMLSETFDETRGA